MPMFNGKNFTDQQMRLIMLGVNHGLNVDAFARPHYTPEKMSDIIGVLSGDTHRYNKKEFSEEQMAMLRTGLEEDLDIDLFANPDFSPKKMESIMMLMISNSTIDHRRLGEFTEDKLKLLELGEDKGLRIYDFFNPEFSLDQMHELYSCALEGYDVTSFNAPAIPVEKMRLFVACLKRGESPEVYLASARSNYALDVIARGISAGCPNKYLDCNTYSADQIEVIVEGVVSGVDVEWYAKPVLPAKEMQTRLKWLQEGKVKDMYTSYLCNLFYNGDDFMGFDKKIKAASPDLNEADKEYIASFYELYLLRLKPEIEIDDYTKIVRTLRRHFQLKHASPRVPHNYYNFGQLQELALGLEHGISYLMYCNNSFEVERMEIIRKLLEEGKDVDAFLNPNLNLDRIKVMTNSSGERFERYANPAYSDEHLHILDVDTAAGYDVSSYAKPDTPMYQVKFLSRIQPYRYKIEDFLPFKYNEEQVAVLNKGLDDRINITHLARPYFSAEELSVIEEALRNFICVHHCINFRGKDSIDVLRQEIKRKQVNRMEVL